MITLPNNFIDNLTAVMSGVFTDLIPLLIFIIAILLGAYLITSLTNPDRDRFNNK